MASKNADGFLPKKIITHLNRRTKLLEKKAVLSYKKNVIDAELTTVNSELDELEKLIQSIQEVHKDAVKEASEKIETKKSSKKIKWADRIISILKSSRKPLLFGEIVDKLSEQDFPEEVTKYTLQKRVNGQLYQMNQSNRLNIVETKDGRKYSIIK